MSPLKGLALATTLALGSCSSSPCEDSPCGLDATCTERAEVEVGYECACDVGFAGDGLECCADGDGDQACDVADNCPEVDNSTQDDFNGDGVGDACDEIVHSVASLSTTATFFDYEGMSATISYFVVIDGLGHPHVAFDACDVCYGAHKGYSQSDDQMVCNNCSNVFDIEGIGTENQGGGCWPGYLPAEITETDVVIQPEDLESGSWYFE